RARPPARPRRDPAEGGVALPRSDGRRVPGHEPPPVRCDRPDRGGRTVLRRRRVPVDLGLPTRRCERFPRAARGGRFGAPADAELPLAPRGPRRGQPPLTLPFLL